MSGFAVMPLADYQDACDAIREKTDGTDVIKSGDMGAQIRGINGCEPYEGELRLIPTLEEQELETKDKLLSGNVVVERIPVRKVEIDSGGVEVQIAGTGGTAPAIPVSKVTLGDETLIDLTGDTVDEIGLAYGMTAHNAAGETITGSRLRRDVSKWGC